MSENRIDVPRVVYKYPLRFRPIFDAPVFHLELPLGAKVVLFDEQDSAFCVWLEIDPNEDQKEERVFEIVGTGTRVPAKAIHRYSFQMVRDEVPFVWHLYERT